MTAKPNNQRQAEHRARGRQVNVVLKCPEACAALDVLTIRTGSQRAAIEHALALAGLAVVPKPEPEVPRPKPYYPL